MQKTVQDAAEHSQELEEGGKMNDRPTETIDEYVHKGTPSRAQFKLWTSKLAGEHLLLALARDVLITFKIFFFPIVAFGGFSFSWSASLYGYINFGQSQLFSQPPYNFDVLHIGYTNFACFVGTLVGLATAGPLSDWIAHRSTQRNGGIREPEMRLPALVPFVLLAVIGQVISAVGAQKQWTWEPIVIVGYFFTGIQVSFTIPSLPCLVPHTNCC